MLSSSYTWRARFGPRPGTASRVRKPPGTRARSSSSSSRVLGREQPGDLAYRRASRLACLDECGQASVVWHPSHHHEVIADLPVRAMHFGHAEVDIRREPAVELGFPRAGLPARLPRAEIQESESHRLLQLERSVPGEIHHRRMRLRHRGKRLLGDHNPP